MKYLLLFLAFYLSHTFVIAQKSKTNASAKVLTKADSLHSLFKNAKQDTSRLNILAQLAGECDEEDVLKYAEEALQLAEKLSTSPNKVIARAGKKGIANASNNIGHVRQLQSDISGAMEWYDKALKVQAEMRDKSGIASSLDNIATLYDNLGDIDKSLEFHYRALKYRANAGGKKGIATSLNNIAVTYNKQGDLQKALEGHRKALKLREEIGDKEGIAGSINNIAAIYNKQGNIPKALEGYQKALKILEEIGDKRAIANTLNNIAIIYKNQGDIVKAMEVLQRALAIWEETESKQGIAHTLCNLAVLEFNFKHYKKAEIYGEQSLQIAKELGFLSLISNAGEVLSDIYKEQGKYKDAFEMFALFKQMADSINNVETRKSGLKKQMQYEFDKRERATKAEQDKKDAVAAEEKQKQKVITYLISVGLFIVLVLAIFILKGYRQKQKDNSIITQQKIEVEAKNDLIEEKNKNIMDSIKYARRIQTSLLPTEKYIDRILNSRLKK